MMQIPDKVVPRFWAKVRKTEGCWLWTGAMQSSRYGQIGWDHKVYLAHRVSYWLHKGAIPVGMQIDHLCRNRLCVNPLHLEVVTNAENVARTNTPQGIVVRTGFCQRGHDLTLPNSRRGGTNKHQCRECHNASMRRMRSRQKGSVVGVDAGDARPCPPSNA